MFLLRIVLGNTSLYIWAHLSLLFKKCFLLDVKEKTPLYFKCILFLYRTGNVSKLFHILKVSELGIHIITNSAYFGSHKGLLLELKIRLQLIHVTHINCLFSLSTCLYLSFLINLKNLHAVQQPSSFILY